MPRPLPLFVLVLSLPLSACEDGKGETGASADGPTWHQDLAPLVEAKCGSCHEAGGIAPFPLETWEEAAPYAAAMAASVAAGSMPPWPADSDCNTYLYDRSLTDEQIATFQAWADADAPEGDPADPAPPLDEAGGGLSRIDASYTMSEPYTPQVEPDEYRCFPFEWEEGDTWLTGFGVTPGERRVVHHVIAFSVSAEDMAQVRAWDEADEGLGYSCFGGPTADGEARMEADWLGGWVPGSTGTDWPEGTGIPMSEGAGMVVQLHYNTETAGALPDQSTVSFMLADSVEKEARIAKILDPSWVIGDGMALPAGEMTTVSFSLDIPVDITLYTAGLHMHTRGASTTLRATPAGGDEGCLLDIPDWDFHWQGSYHLAEALPLAAGSTVSLSCTFDNTEGGADMAWGEGTDDEMCLGTAYVTVE